MDGAYTPFYGAAYAGEQRTPERQRQGMLSAKRAATLSLRHTMIELLLRADAVVVSDQARNRQLIGRVMDILHATLTEHEDAASATAGRLAPWQESRLKTHIEINLNVSLTTADLAEFLNLSPSYFFSGFQEELRQAAPCQVDPVPLSVLSGAATVCHLRATANR
jgi:AraC-like DNA-binding protein